MTPTAHVHTHQKPPTEYKKGKNAIKNKYKKGTIGENV